MSAFDLPTSARARELIEMLSLQPHPEGGWYHEVFRSSQHVQPNDMRDVRSAITTIYFLLTDEESSRFHRVASDEVWHFYEGSALELVWLDVERNEQSSVRLDQPTCDAKPVAVVPANCWQAARTTGAYTLVGCSVGPGFEFADFEMFDQRKRDCQELVERFPNAADWM